MQTPAKVVKCRKMLMLKIATCATFLLNFNLYRYFYDVTLLHSQLRSSEICIFYFHVCCCYRYALFGTSRQLKGQSFHLSSNKMHWRPAKLSSRNNQIEKKRHKNKRKSKQQGKKCRKKVIKIIYIGEISAESKENYVKRTCNRN